jgi:small subunit ribosomal protein S16
MLAIRFSRIGKKNKAQFKIMLQEHTFAPGGRHVEVLGSYDPHKKTAVLNEEKIKHWLSKGVKVSDTVHNLLVSRGIIRDKKRVVKIPQKAKEAEGKEIEKEEKEEKAEAVAKTAKNEIKIEEKKPADAEVLAEKGGAEDN